MVADLCRLYHYSTDHVLSMPMKRAGFLWSRGVVAERMQAFRIAAAMNGKDLDKELKEKDERRKQWLAGKPSPKGQAIMDAMLKGLKHD